MKKTLTVIMAVLALSTFVFSEMKIGVINAQEVVMKTKKGQRIQTELEALSKSKQAQIQKMQNDMKTLEKDLTSPALNVDTREKKKRELQDKRIQLQRYVEDAQKEVQMKTNNELQDMQKDIMPLIQDIGKAQGFTLIFDVTSSGIAYFDQAVDITPQVITAVDTKFQ